MHDDKPDMKTLLTEADAWKARDAESFFACVGQIYLNDYPYKEFVVTAHELAQLHPTLPASLHCMLTHWKQSRDCPVVHRFCLLGTLDYLNNQAISFTNVDGRVVHAVQLRYLRRPRRYDDRVVVAASYLDLRTADIDGVTIPFALSSTQRDDFVSDTELDKLYPGWKSRWHVADELGMCHTDVPDYVFNPALLSDAQPNLNGVEFG